MLYELTYASKHTKKSCSIYFDRNNLAYAQKMLRMLNSPLYDYKAEILPIEERRFYSRRIDTDENFSR
jgi:hypothetical protein